MLSSLVSSWTLAELVATGMQERMQALRAKQVLAKGCVFLEVCCFVLFCVCACFLYDTQGSVIAPMRMVKNQNGKQALSYKGCWQ